MPLDKRRCELVGGVRFSNEAFRELEWLADYCLLYADPGAEGRTAPAFMAPHFREPSNENRQRALHILLLGVRTIWRASGGTGSGTWYNREERDKNGRLINLILSMFVQMGVGPPLPPSARTLRRALQEIDNS